MDETTMADVLVMLGDRREYTQIEVVATVARASLGLGSARTSILYRASILGDDGERQQLSASTSEVGAWLEAMSRVDERVRRAEETSLSRGAL